MIRVVSAIILSALALSACQKQGDANPEEAIKAISAAEAQLGAAFNARDPVRVAALYASDATAYVPGEQRPRVGTEAIRKGAEKDLADPAFHLTMTRAKAGVFAPGDTGYTKGSFTIRYTDPQTKAAASYSGYYLTLYSRQKDGSWKIFEDMATPAS